jgi:hypothetical protein
VSFRSGLHALEKTKYVPLVRNGTGNPGCPIGGPVTVHNALSSRWPSYCTQCAVQSVAQLLYTMRCPFGGPVTVHNMLSIRWPSYCTQCAVQSVAQLLSTTRCPVGGPVTVHNALSSRWPSYCKQCAVQSVAQLLYTMRFSGCVNVAYLALFSATPGFMLQKN